MPLVKLLNSINFRATAAWVLSEVDKRYVDVCHLQSELAIKISFNYFPSNHSVTLSVV